MPKAPKKLVAHVAVRPSLATMRRRTPKACEVIAKDLINYIVDNDLPEGSMLPVENEMLEMLGVGRTTLREALRLVEARGMIEIRTGPQGGPVVRRPEPQHLGDALTLMLQYDGATMADVLEARHALEPTLAGLAAKRMTPEQLAELDDTIATILASLDDHAVFTRENMRFHAIVAEAAGSVVVRRFLEQLETIRQGKLIGSNYSAERRREVAEVHAAIADAIRAGNAEKATELMREHVGEATDYWRAEHSEMLESPIRWSG